MRNTTMDQSINPDQITVMEAEVVNQPFVQEEDFPKKSSRLEGLIAQYRKDQKVSAPVQTANPLAKAKVKPGVKIKTYDSLKPAEQQKVMARIDGIDYTVSGDILNFGSARESAMTKHAEVIISKYSAHEIEEITEPMTDLVATLKSNNPSAIVKGINSQNVDDDKKWGLVESVREFFAMKRAKEQMYKALARRNTIMQNLQELKIEMEKRKLSLQQDIEVYEQMGRATFEQVNEFGLDCVALSLMIEDAKTKLNRMLNGNVVDEDGNPSAIELDQEELYQAQNLQSAVERMERRMHAITSVRVSTVQTMPMQAAIIKGDEIICEKIDEVLNLIIPMWSWQYAIAIGAIKQQEALNLQKRIRGITSQLLTGNAKMLHDNMIAAQEELNTAAVAIEDLQIVQDYIEDMVTTVQAKAKEASAKMMEGMKTMQQIEQRNYDLMAQPMLEEATNNMMGNGKKA